MKTRTVSMNWGCLVAALALNVGLTASAEAADATADTRVVEEIIVTAQKRSENLQDVPVAMSVVTGDTLAELDYANITDLEKLVPSVKFADSVHPRGEGFSIRGVGTSTFSVAAEQSVGVVVDGVPVGQGGAGVFNLVDVAQIEVLRGPQGMLFGKNSTAGIIKIDTNKPNLDDYGYQIRLSGAFRDSDHFQNKVEGIANLALSDTLGLRLVGARTDQDGFVENVFNGNELNGKEEYGLRAKLLWQPSEDLEVYFIAANADRETNCCIWTTRTAPAGNAIIAAQAPVVASPSNEQVNLNEPTFYNMDMNSFSLNVEYALGDYVLTSITDTRSWDIELNADTDQAPINQFDRNYGATGQTQFSQELRIASPAGGQFEYVAGLYYFHQEVDSRTIQVVNIPGVLSLGRDAQQEFESDSFAAFAQATIALSDRLRLIGGARYTFEDLEGVFNRVQSAGSTVALTPPLTFDFDTDADEPSWRFGVQYDFADSMIYATAARGFKGPTANILADFNTPTESAILVDPEFATSYELGLKSTWAGGRITTNVAIYDTTFEDFQAQTFDRTVTPSVFRIANAGELATRGVEVDMTAVPLEGLVITGAVAYADTEFEEFATTCYPFQTVAQGCVPIPGSGGQAAVDASGSPLNGASEWTYTLTAAYGGPISPRLEWHVLGNYHWQDEANSSAANGDPNTIKDAYGIFNLNVGLGSRDGKWTLSAFAKNLFDKHYVKVIFPNPLYTAPPNPSASYAQFPEWGSERILGMSLAVAL